MWHWLLPVLLCVVALALPVEGGGSGDDTPPGSGDWVIDEPTAVWDEAYNLSGGVRVNSTGSLTLTNVSLRVAENFTIQGPVTLINSTVVMQGINKDIEIDATLLLRNASLHMNLSQRPGEQNDVQRVVVHNGGNLTIADYDGDRATTYDRSLVSDGDGDDDEANPASANSTNYRFRFIVENGGELWVHNSEVSEIGWKWDTGDYSRTGLLLDSPNATFDGAEIHHSFYGLVAGGHAEWLIVRNSSFTDMGNTGIHITYFRIANVYYYPDHWLIEHTYFGGISQYPIKNYGRYGTLRNNTFDGYGQAALYAYYTARWGTATGNRFEDGRQGLVLQHADNWAIANNTFVRQSGAGIYLQGGANNIVIRDNVFEACGSGLSLLSIEQTWGTKDHYYSPSNVQFHYNTLTGGGNGVTINGLGTKDMMIPDGGYNIVIEHNGIDGAATGLVLSVGDETPDTFRGMEFRDNTVSAGIGLTLNGGAGSLNIHHNHFTALIGAALYGGSDQYLENNTFTGLVNDGIKLVAGENHIVRNNSLAGGASGLVIEGGDGHQLQDNVIANVSWAGLLVRNGATVNLSRNHVTNATIGLAREATPLAGWNNSFTAVEWAYYHLDLNISLEGDVLVEVEGLLWEAWSIRVHTYNSYGAQVRDKPFVVRDVHDEEVLAQETGNDGYSAWYPITVAFTYLNHSVVAWTPHTIIVAHQWSNATAIVNVNRSLTLEIELDIIPPASDLDVASRYSGGIYWVKEAWFPVTWNLTDDSDDLLHFHIEYAVNDGGGWGPWQPWGNFTNLTARFPGLDGHSYRFRSTAYDIYGNNEDKTGDYEAEIEVDLTPPASLLRIIEEPGEVTNLAGLTVAWELDSENEFVIYTIEVRTLIGGEPSPWNPLVENTTTLDYWFVPPDDRTYQFRSRAADRAGNVENKPVPDVTVTIDRQPPMATLAPLPPLWGADNVTLTFTEPSEPLVGLTLKWATVSEATLLALGGGSSIVLEWSDFSPVWENDSALFPDLQDGYVYFFRLLPRDLAGTEAPRETVVADFTTNGSANATIALPVLPLPPEVRGGITVMVDEGGDGTYEREVEQGANPALLLANQYYLDFTTGRLHFGDDNTGYRPPANASVRVSFTGYDGRLTVDTSLPEPPRELDYTMVDNTTVRLLWKESADAVAYRVERSTNLSLGWTPVAEITPKGDGYTSYTDADLLTTRYHYRVVAVDRMGYTRATGAMEVDLTPVTGTENPAQTAAATDWGEFAPVAGVVALLLLVAVVLTLRRRKSSPAPKPRSPKRTLRPTPQLERLMDAVEVAEAVGPPVAVSPFKIQEGSEFAREPRLACSGCGRIFPSPGGELMACPGCGVTGPPP